MADINFSIAALLNQVFGIDGQAFDPEFQQLTARLETGVHGTPYYAVDANGLEYFMPVTISYPDPNVSGEQVTLDLPYSVVGIRAEKCIIETPLTERRGTVKELIQSRDYEITVKGFMIADGNNFPEADCIRLKNLWEEQIAVSLKCAFTDIFLLSAGRKGSDHVVIKRFEVPHVVGVKNVRAYSFEMVSDEPFNLIDIS